MNSYRAAPNPRKPIIIRAKRSFLAAALLAAVLGFMGLLEFVVFSQSVLRCSRADNSCTLTVRHGPDVLQRSETFDLKSLRRATVEELKPQAGSRVSRSLWGIALEVHGGVEVVQGYSDSNMDAKKAWVDQVNRFLDDPSQPSLEVEYGFTWPAYLISFFMVLIFVAWLRARKRFVIDPMHQAFRIEERIFATTVRTVPFVDIKEAFVDEHEKNDDERTKTHGVALRLCDDRVQPLHDYSTFGKQAKEKLAAQINQALAEAGKR